MTEPKEQPKAQTKRGKEEHIFAIVLVLFVGLVVTCVVVILIASFRMMGHKSIHCVCPDGTTADERTSAMFTPEQVCPSICAERQKAAPK